MLVAVPELTGVYPLTLDEPIALRSIYLFQRKNQPLSIAAKHLRQMLLGDRSREVKNSRRSKRREFFVSRFL